MVRPAQSDGGLNAYLTFPVWTLSHILGWHDEVGTTAAACMYSNDHVVYDCTFHAYDLIHNIVLVDVA